MGLGRTFASVRKYRNYRLYFYGQMVSVCGSWMQDTALPWLVLQETHSPAHVGGLVFARFVPFTVLGLFAGIVSDRFDNRRVVIVSQAVSFLVAAIMAGLVFADSAPLWAIYVLAFASGLAILVESPARHALVYQSVGREELTNAVALNSMLASVARIAGPALGGVVIGAFGVSWCFAANAFSFLVVWAMIAMIRPSELVPLDRDTTLRQSMLAGLREAAAFVRRSVPLQVAFVLLFALNLIGFNQRVALPVMAETGLHASAELFGTMFACYGGGCLVAAFGIATMDRASWRPFFIGAYGLSGAMVGLALTRSVVLVAVLFALTGLTFTLWTSITMSILQLASADHLRGRIIGFGFFGFFGLSPLGGFLFGWLADLAGLTAAFLITGLVPALFVVAGMARLRAGAAS